MVRDCTDRDEGVKMWRKRQSPFVCKEVCIVSKVCVRAVGGVHHPRAYIKQGRKKEENKKHTQIYFVQREREKKVFQHRQVNKRYKSILIRIDKAWGEKKRKWKRGMKKKKLPLR